MTFREIIEREDQNVDSIWLYREGMFMKAYERSAFFAQAYSRDKFNAAAIADLV